MPFDPELDPAILAPVTVAVRAQALVSYTLDPAIANPKTGRDRLKRLSWLLRNPQEWPEGHDWNFETVCRLTRCGTVGCAIGVAQLDAILEMPVNDDWELFFEMGEDESCDIFSSPDIYRVPWSEVTPAMVAATIDHYLLTGEAVYPGVDR